jgi:uncharacterized membrane protein YheB (UPF0754 family)
MKYNLKIDEEGVKINGTLINEVIFNQEMVDYSPREREDEIDHLIDWIGECGRDRENDKRLMKQDLKMLMTWKCEDILSSISTNHYLKPTDKEFKEVCKEILKLNEELKNGTN